MSGTQETLEALGHFYFKGALLGDYSGGVSSYGIDMVLATQKTKNKDRLKFQIGSKHQIEFLLKDSMFPDMILFDVYVNDTFIGASGVAIQNGSAKYFMDLFGEDLVLQNPTNDIRGHSIFVVDSNQKVHTLPGLNNGMLANSVGKSYGDHAGIDISMTRLTHGPAIDDHNKYHMILKKSECEQALRTLGEDFVVEAFYHYKYENGKINLTPEVLSERTLKEYLASDSSVCVN